MSTLTFPSDQRLSGVHFVLFVTIANRKARPVVNANWGVHSLLDAMARLSVEWWLMIGKVSVVIEQDEHGYYAWCPELKGCQSQGTTVENALTNIREAIELYMETLTDEERLSALSRESFTTAVEVHA